MNRRGPRGSGEGDEGAPVGQRAHDSPVSDDGLVPVSVSVDAVVRSLRGPSAKAVAGVFAGWEEAVGPQVAAHARPVSLDGGRLVVEVDEPGWATQLRYLEATLRDRLAAVSGGFQVTSVEVRVRAR